MAGSTFCTVLFEYISGTVSIYSKSRLLNKVVSSLYFSAAARSFRRYGPTVVIREEVSWSWRSGTGGMCEEGI